MRFCLLFVLLLLAACGSRPGPELLRAVDAPSVPGARLVTVYAATTRARESHDSNVFLPKRSDTLNFAEFTISIPPGHQAGRIEWPDGAPDPARTFATVRQRVLSRAEFEAKTAPKPGLRRAGLFVHGFNVNFQEALFQMAQMGADAEISGALVMFAWPSEASVSGYLADKDAVTASRDGLADVITMLAAKRAVGETLVLAHSMGAWLTAETLRQLRLSGKGALLDRLEVVFAAPDIDVDVFRSQLAVIGRLNRPMTVLVAPDDLALRVSSRLAGRRERVGRLDVSDPRVISASQRYNIVIIDISKIESSDSFNHSRFAKIAGLQGRLYGESGEGGVRRAGAFILNSVGATLASPFSLVGEVIAPH